MLAAQQPSATPEQVTPRAASVQGRLVKPSTNGAVPIPGIMVTIHRVGTDSAGALDSVRTDAKGGYKFQYRRWGSAEAVYFAAAVYHGIAYFSSPMRTLAVVGEEAEIVVFDTTSQPLQFTVQGHHLVVGAARPTGLRDIVEVYELSNDTTVTSVGRDSLTPVWSAPLPRGARNFVAGQGDVAASSLQVRDGQVVLLAPFAPGVKQLSFSYALEASDFPLELRLDRANAVLEVLLEEQGAQVRSASLRSQGMANTQGRSFKRFLGQNAPKGEVVRIDVPPSTAVARSTIVIALTVVITLSMMIALWVAFRRGATARAPSPAPESIETLAAAIAALDARHSAHDASLADESYRAERDALKSRLAVALAGGGADR